MTEKQATDLKAKIKADFLKEFGVELTDEDFTENEGGYELDYWDYDLNNLPKYHHSPLVESARFEYDGRAEHIVCHAELEYSDYFTD